MPERQAWSARIDFEGWARLAESDPAAFEKWRARLLEQTIARAPAHRQQRLRCLQWKIDQIRGRCGTPMAACVKLNAMMWASLAGPGGLLQVLERLATGSTPHPGARILALRPIRRP